MQSSRFEIVWPKSVIKVRRGQVQWAHLCYGCFVCSLLFILFLPCRGWGGGCLISLIIQIIFYNIPGQTTEFGSLNGGSPQRLTGWCRQHGGPGVHSAACGSCLPCRWLFLHTTARVSKMMGSGALQVLKKSPFLCFSCSGVSLVGRVSSSTSVFFSSALLKWGFPPSLAYLPFSQRILRSSTPSSQSQGPYSHCCSYWIWC